MDAPISYGGNFHIMAKPAGSVCNLDCTYCYYLEKEDLYPERTSFRMSEEVLEEYVRQFIEACALPEVTFFWQGGEPTLMGLDFFRRAVELQKQYAPDGRVITNSLQTNGTLIDTDWIDFFAENNFLIGLSIDGPKRLHDRFRVDKKNTPTFDTVAATAEKLRDGGVEFNTLTTIHRRNVKFGGEVYRFLRDLGVTFMQFIPIVERKMPEGELAGPPDGGVLDEAAALTEWSVPADGYGDFMCDVFDFWVKRDVGEVFVQMFDVHLGAWLEEPPGLCVNAKTCGQNMVLEHNGDLYACDHFVYDSYRLGNITETPLVELANSAPQLKFGEDKFDQLPGDCRGCWFLSACFGGCPKHRFVRTSDDEPGLNYLCPSYKKFAAHTEPVMSQMAELLRRRQPASRIMDILGQQKAGGNKSTPGRNDSCPCGSGKKYKKCCG